MSKPTSKDNLVKIETDKASRIEQDDEVLEIGQWYWVKDTEREWVDDDEYEDDGYYEYEEYEWLGCIVHIGSNFVKVERAGQKWSSTIRIHLNAFDKRLRPEPNPKAVIETEIRKSKDKVAKMMGEVKAISDRLGVSPRLGLPQPQSAQSYALAKLSGIDNVEAYETSLVKAKEEDLPKLFKQIEEENEHLAVWMKAETLPLKAMAESMQGVIGEIHDRIFNVSLYAGLTEQVRQIREGEPASYDEKLRLMQRLLYMDEECLLGYRTGGIDFKSINEFDDWIAEPENFERIFPFPRCMVALQVRRKAKKRSWGGSLAQALINIRPEEQDHFTFLYIRNGEQLYWMGCDLEFDDLIFPERDEFDLTQPMMLQKNSFGEFKIITVSDYEERCKKRKKARKAFKRWRRKNTLKNWRAANLEMLQEDVNKQRWYAEEEDREIQASRVKWLWERANPHRGWDRFDPDVWKPLDKTHLYYDEAMETVTKRVKYYNRIALIIQGLYDRSEILHPHPPVKTWTPEGFVDAIELVYDGSHVLYDGDPPSFEDYVTRCNESIDADSVLIGQDEFWQRREAEKENKRRTNDWRSREYEREVEFFTPYGNPGPGFITRPARWQKRARKATFTWMRKRQRYYRWGDNDPLPTKITVPVEHLFNVSAYKPGDFLQFFQDPRTRQDYLKWAPALLTAEEWHAGNIKAQGPIK